MESITMSTDGTRRAWGDTQLPNLSYGSNIPCILSMPSTVLSVFSIKQVWRRVRESPSPLLEAVVKPETLRSGRQSDTFCQSALCTVQTKVDRQSGDPRRERGVGLNSTMENLPHTTSLKEIHAWIGASVPMRSTTSGRLSVASWTFCRIMPRNAMPTMSIFAV